jgi:serine phosphatase RsbU (regulator of sigma subunit)
VLDSGQTFFAPHIDNRWIETHAANKVHADFMHRMQYRSMIVVPVRSQIWGVTGALTLVRVQDSRPYDRSAIGFAEDLGRRCGVAIGKARLYSQTADIAERLQKAALPQTLPTVPGLTFDTLYEPADAALLVGGDWYDVFDLPDGKVGVSIGDVSGHGIESAAQMSSIRNALRMALVMENDLTKVLRDADFLFDHEVSEGTFCTALVGIIDPDNRTLRCAAAGHPSPLVCTSRGIEAPLEDRAGVPLALASLTNRQPEEVVIPLESGAIVVLFTDGLLESEQKPLTGEEKLRRIVADPALRTSPTPARDIRDKCVTGWHSDDIAILIIQCE